MKIPNAAKAIIDMQKLTDYCLNTTHPRGKHKAHVFEKALGITVNEADMLYEALHSAIVNEEAVEDEKDGFGQRYTVDFEMTYHEHRATVRSTWIIRTNEDFPRLVSSYVL